jgi:UDP-N-acetylmuramate--alanine ligase
LLVVDAVVDLGRPYFIGIGGIGMSGLARICVARGAQVGGSDAKDSTLLQALRQLGAQVHAGHDAEHLRAFCADQPASCVVVSQAIRTSNAELQLARTLGLPVVHRAQALAALMVGYRAVLVAGTHGKSSTTTMLAVAFQGLGLDPSFSVGADLNEPGSNAHHGRGDIFVAEADESDRSFHHYRPEVAIILNIEEDHHDHYSSLAEHIDSYETFARRVRPGGALVVSADHPAVRELTARLADSAPSLRIVTYGEAADADVQIVKIETQGFGSVAIARTAEAGEMTIRLRVPGRHMAHNAIGALAVGIATGVAPTAMADALGGYRGIRRRFTVRGNVGGVSVIDSYAHHPTEVAADLETARVTVSPGGRVIAVFQPHLYSRTHALGVEIGKQLATADLAIVMSVYGGREEPIPGVTHQIVAHAALAHGAMVRVEERWSAVPDVVSELVQPGDLVLTMGAGDVTQLGPEILDRVATRLASPPGR